MNYGFPYTSSGGFSNLAIESLQDTVTAGKPAKRFTLMGIAWDGYVISQASHILCDDHLLFDTTPVDDSVDLGDLLLLNNSLEAMRAALMPQASALIAQHEMVWLSGNHSITLLLLRAHYAY